MSRDFKGENEVKLLKYFPLLMPLAFSGCISAWMTAGTGKRIYFGEGTPKPEVRSVLGEPFETSTEIDPRYRKAFSWSKRTITHLEKFAYNGKINSPAEGSSEATANAVSLGTAEVVMIPLTALSIVTRSLGRHIILVFYDENNEVVGFEIDPIEMNRSDE